MKTKSPRRRRLVVKATVFAALVVVPVVTVAGNAYASVCGGAWT